MSPGLQVGDGQSQGLMADFCSVLARMPNKNWSRQCLTQCWLNIPFSCRASSPGPGFRALTHVLGGFSLTFQGLCFPLVGPLGSFLLISFLNPDKPSLTTHTLFGRCYPKILPNPIYSTLSLSLTLFFSGWFLIAEIHEYPLVLGKGLRC